MKVYFQGLKVYFHDMKVYFQAMKILFGTSERNLWNARKEFVGRVGEVYGTCVASSEDDSSQSMKYEGGNYWLTT